MNKPKLTSENIQNAVNEFFSSSETSHFGNYVIQLYDVKEYGIHPLDNTGSVNRKVIEYEKNTVEIEDDEYVVDNSFESNLDNVLEDIKDMLLNKNRKYGNAALEPLGIFAKGSSSSLINVRIDDKLNRIKNQQEDEDEDAEKDLIGYLILKQIAKSMESK